MAKFGSTGNDINSKQLHSELSAAGGGKVGARQIEVPSVSPPGVRDSGGKGLPEPKHKADRPGV